MKFGPKIVNLIFVFFPVFLFLPLAENGVLQSSNTTLDVLDNSICEWTNQERFYAEKNAAVTFLFMLLPTFLACTLPYFWKLTLQYENIESLMFVSLLVYSTVAGVLFYGFAIQKTDFLNGSSEGWLFSFLISKSISKLGTTRSRRRYLFFGVLISMGLLNEPFISGKFMRTKDFAIVVLNIVEVCYAFWVERKFPNIFIAFAMFFWTIGGLFDQLSFNTILLFLECVPDNRFQLLPAARGCIAVSTFFYFIAVRKQEKVRDLLVQNKFEQIPQAVTTDEEMI